jgi:hypothetical protein
MEEKIIQILVQGGLTGVALTSLYITYKLISNHLSHLAEVMERLEVTISKMLQFLEDHKK